MMVLGVEFIWGQHNHARLEFYYGAMITAGHRKNHYVVHDDISFYGVRAFDRFIGLIRFTKEKTIERRPEPPDEHPR